MRPTYCKFVVVVACREAGSGEARWHAELGIMAPVRYGSTVYEWLYGPPPPPNRAGDYPHETRYYVVPGDGRYRSAGVRGVPRAHVDLVMSCLEGATVNPHCSGTTDEGNWIDGDIPSAAIVAALLREAELAEQEATETLAAATRKAALLRSDASDLRQRAAL